MIKYLLRIGCLLFSVVWYDFLSKQTCPFFLTIANHSFTRCQISNENMSYSMQKVQQLGNIIWGILEYAPALA